MQDMIIHLVEQFGYIGIILLIAFENIFPPISLQRLSLPSAAF